MVTTGATVPRWRVTFAGGNDVPRRLIARTDSAPRDVPNGESITHVPHDANTRDFRDKPVAALTMLARRPCDTPAIVAGVARNVPTGRGSSAPLS